MKYIKLLFFSAIILLLAVTGVTLLLPSHVRVSRAINLYAGADSVLSEVGDLSRWKNWYPGFDTLQLKDVTVAGGRVTRATVKNIQLEVTTSADSLVTVQMKKGVQPVLNSWRLIRYAHSDSLTLQNYMDFNFKWYPWERFSGLLVDRSYGQIMEEGLKKLKENVH
ncbi:SRPBCC family protein [Niabella aurantiaca]|uniref:SRPBCC family protein n=1 Tax=Niabella aurantiaca TaxID=379900 RepID=UPI0003820F71|nr:SRPBCC family protein [Niabella aurantiaca]